MTTQTKALKLALEALELNNKEWKSLADSGDAGYWLAEEQDHYQQTEQAITAIKEALAQPEQEPVAFLTNHRQRMNVQIKPEAFVWMPTTTDWEVPLYTTPPQRTWVGLTDEEIAEIENGYVVDYRIPAGCGWNFAKDIEAKLKEKNT